MKKWIYSTCSLLLVLIVGTACSASESAELEDIYQNALEANEELENFEMNAELEQSIVMGEESIPVSATIQSQMQQDPVAFHQTMDMMGQEIEMYYSKEGIFMKEPVEGKWVKGPEELVDQLNQLAGQEQQNPAEQMELLKDYVKDFELEETEDTYVLNLNADGLDIQELMKEQLGGTIPEDQLTDEMMESVSVNKLTYTFTLSKDTYYPQTMTVDMDMEIDEQGNKTNLTQKMDATYSKFNELGTIEVPQEIKDSAEDMEMPGL
ncbi:DUF6612 family protein [Sediminibacillus massiliensis]|uniref:DUF6612 family protein n=1 Tax=Sediminibacillus massiliensis TaxID=1926277 RepID=UPI0009884FBD|nr:DUF6612 family protein [Sediminibacillus massiliensis]